MTSPATHRTLLCACVSEAVGGGDGSAPEPSSSTIAWEADPRERRSTEVCGVVH